MVRRFAVRAKARRFRRAAIRFTLRPPRKTARQGAGKDMSLIEAGAAAPAFSMTNQDGMTVNLDDFAGRYVLLWWYPKASTPG